MILKRRLGYHRVGEWLPQTVGHEHRRCPGDSGCPNKILQVEEESAGLGDGGRTGVFTAQGTACAQVKNIPA